MCLIFVALAIAAKPRIRNSAPEPESSLAPDMLAAHNAVRARLELPPLQWAPRLTAYAQDWADRLLREDQFYHHPHPAFGENLFEITGTRALPTDVVGVWASEAGDYTYSSNTCRGVCGHYTQLIWASTRQVGCAVARDAVREVWVCNYDPPGNWLGERPY